MKVETNELKLIDGSEYQVGDIKSVWATFMRLECRIIKYSIIKYDSHKHRLSLNLDTLKTLQIKYDLILIFKLSTI